MVGWWQGEGNALDLQNANHGAFVGNAAIVAGINGQAFNFDGSGDLIVVSNSSSLQLQDLTIEAWVKRADATLASHGSGNVGVIFGYGNGGYIFYMDSGGSLYFAKLGDFSGVSSSLTVTDTNFHHIAVTKSGDSIAFYVDGVAEVVAPYNPLFEFTSDAAIGARSDNFDNSFLGRIDELSVYSRSLFDYEIQSIYSAGGDGKCQPAIAPQIVTQPTDTLVELGGQATFAVQAIGATPITYQWFFNGTNLPGATAASLTLSNIQPAVTGEYAALVTNAYGSVMSSTGVLSIPPPPACAAWPTGMVSWWRGESNAFDHIGGNNGALTGNVSYVLGRVGLGFTLDGNGDLVVLGNPSQLQLQDFTIETWIRRGSSSVASFGSGGNGILFGYGPGGYIMYMNGSGRLFFGKLGASAVNSSWQVTDTNLHHVAVTKSNTTVTLYLDVTNVFATVYNQTFTFTTPAAIGGRADNLDNSFLGTIDELAIYGRALSPAEINTIQSAGVSGKCVVALPPEVVLQPASQTVFPGSNVMLSASVSGTPPLVLQWFREATALGGATNASLTLSNIQPSHAGNYSLRVTNELGQILSSNAALKVIVVTATGNGQPLTNISHAFNTAVTVQLQNVYSNALTFYTLDGSQPTFASSQYTGPFVLSNSVVLRALGYRSDFFESGELGPIFILLPPSYPLTIANSGGGSVMANPANGPYISNTVVTLTATPNAGWQLLHWLGDAGGNNPVIAITMNRQKAVQAVFGTTLSTTAAGGGTVILSPSGGLYPYGAAVQLAGIPNAGNQFALWGNAASGNVNPLNFIVTNANPTVSSLFAAVGGGQAALTVVPVGLGQVGVNPRANVYATGAGVTITATPNAGQSFVGWSGDASGTQNPLSVTMNQNKLIHGNFTAKPRLSGESISAEGFCITLSGDYLATYQLESSTNLASWTPLSAITNTSGTVQFLDSGATNALHRFYRAFKLP